MEKNSKFDDQKDYEGLSGDDSKGIDETVANDFECVEEDTIYYKDTEKVSSLMHEFLE